MGDDTATTDERPWPEPRANPVLIGHETAEAMMAQAFRAGRMGSAWLITGPRGIGKATFAFRLARWVLARRVGARLDPAGSLAVDPDSPVFRRVAARGHADLHTVERRWDEARNRRRSEILVDDIRGLGEFLRLTPAEGDWRVAVVDDAEEMNRNAANALLKVLEEPPERALILLVSHAPGRLPATVRSRCRRLPLRPLDDEALAEIVRRHLPALPAEDVEALARLAEGSAGRALEIGREGGLDLYREMLELLDGLPGLDGAALHRFGDRLAPARAESAFRAASDLLVWWLGRLVRAAATGTMPPEVVAGEAALTERLLSLAGLDHWLEVWEKVRDLTARAESAGLGRKQVILNAFFALDPNPAG